MPEEKKEIEKTEPRVIKVNEWFTPFAKYHDAPYDVPGNDYLAKTFEFIIADLGNFKFHVSWEQEDQQNPEAQAFFNYLLVLPTGEKIVEDTQETGEQAKMETKILRFSIHEDSGKNLESVVNHKAEIELPSGTVISIPMEVYDDTAAISGNFAYDGQKIQTLVIPETQNILGKIKVRILLNN